MAAFEIVERVRRRPQVREAEEWRNRPLHGARNGAEPKLDLVLGLVELHALQPGMRPGMRADRVAALCNLAHHGRIGGCHTPHHEEGRLGALRVERLQDHWRVGAGWSVVERQHDLTLVEKIVLTEWALTEYRALSRVDLDDTRQAENV